jgi:ceramide glucosyltransferase
MLASLHVVLASLLSASIAYHVATLICARKWVRDSRNVESLDEGALLPAVSILKPICGRDAEHDRNLRSFCELDYPEFEVIFGALDANDPGLEEAYRLQREFGEEKVHIVAGGEALGLNRKVSTLIVMSPAARHDLFVLADSDMRVQAHYLRQVVASFSAPGTGLVTCPYRAASPRSVSAVFEALGIGAEFIPSAFLAYFALGQRFAFGSTIAIRRRVLNEIGGFESMVDLLADDFALAERTTRAGYAVRLSGYVVDDVMGNEPARAIWRRRLRWARTARALRQGPYYGLFVTFTIPIALATALIAGSAIWTEIAFACVLFRTLIAAVIAATCTRDRVVLRSILLLPVSEFLSAAIWLASLCGRTIHWRGKVFKVNREGALVCEEEISQAPLQ